MIADDLRAAELFAGLRDDQLEKLAAIAEPLRLPAGGAVFAQGAAADAFYVLAAGRIKVFKTLRDGRTATVRHVDAGQTFGESVLFHERYPSGAEAMTQSLLYRLPTVAFRALLLEEPELAVRLLGAMARLLVMLNQRVEDLLLPVPARLARYLIEICDEQSGEAGGELPLACRLPTSKRELAARLGTVPETLSRTLNQLSRSGAITRDGERFAIVDRAALERIAQLDRD